MTEQIETNDSDRWLAALQEAILERQRARFSAKVLDEARQPQNMGVISNPDGQALVSSPCGDAMAVFLRLQDSRIQTATFLTDGCGPTVACGSMLTQLAQGKALEEAAGIDAADVISALDGLPPEHIHCATLAVNALQAAIADHKQGRDKD